MGLQPGGLVGYDSIGRGMALIKAVLRKLLHQVEQLGSKLFGVAFF